MVLAGKKRTKLKVFGNYYFILLSLAGTVKGTVSPV
jgi:hypothetical protein